MIDILIPTYNRCFFLIKNIIHINSLIHNEGLHGIFKIIVSDNFSDDNTKDNLKLLITKKNVDLDITIFEQDYNMGGEANCVFLLSKSSSEYFMYIGDDDYLPDGYLTYLVNKLRKDSSTSVVVPGLSALYADGTAIPLRMADYEENEYSPGFSAALKISHFGHQLSGILFKRNGVLSNYLKDYELRNMYPFIFFLSFNSLRGKSYFSPKYKVLVSVDNKKHWQYDDSGFLTEIFKNYKILYPKSPLKRLLLCLTVICRQRWRLRIGRSLIDAFKAFCHLMKSEHVDLTVKISLVFLYPLIYVYILIDKMAHWEFARHSKMI